HTRLQGDWSSDVCSSDLSMLMVSHGSTRPLGDSREHFHTSTVSDKSISPGGGVSFSGASAPSRYSLVQPLGICTLSGVLRILNEIGRASCRERGVILVWC